MGISLTPEEQLEIFGTTRLAEHAEEARQRWGDTDAWKESQRRTATYTKDDWIRIKQEADASIATFAELVKCGEPATSEAAMGAAESYRQHLSRWFYDCGHAQHRALADMYISDPRYTTTYDDIAPGLAQYVHDAIHANANRAAER